MDMVDFTWSRCRDKYRLEQHQPRAWLTGKPVKWERFGLDREKCDRPRWSLEAASDRFERYRPLKFTGLFSIFAEKTPASRKGMQQFCNAFGLPGGFGPAESKTDEIQVQGVDELLSHQRRFRGALALYRNGDLSELARAWNSIENLAIVHTEFRVGETGRLEMVFVPSDLIQAMWLQFAQFACSEANLFRCERCNEPFIVGTGTGRRSTAKYCSNACRVAAFKDRKQESSSASA